LGGPEAIAIPLAGASDRIKGFETSEGLLQSVLLRHAEIRKLEEAGSLSVELKQEIDHLSQEIDGVRRTVIDDRRKFLDALNAAIDKIRILKETR
jgi:hypothetical protein